MKTIIIYYSHTGNNALLAEKIAKDLGAPLFQLLEAKPRTTARIFFDMLFQRKPKLMGLPENIEDADLVLFLGPVWMFHIPSPLRSCFQALKSKVKRYAFVSLSGGALGPNPGLAKELVRCLGKNMAFHLDLTATQFCQVKGNPTTEDTRNFHLKDFPQDLEKLSRLVVQTVKTLRI